jgi:hypothetical protein
MFEELQLEDFELELILKFEKKPLKNLLKKSKQHLMELIWFSSLVDFEVELDQEPLQ